MKVLVIPEDFRKDQHMLKPIVESMMKAKGKTAKVEVCKAPLLGGIVQALKWDRIKEIIGRYKKIDLFLLCVDRDGEANRRIRLNELELKAADILPEGKAFLAENAWQEIEVWVLAGQRDLPSEWIWKEVRAALHPKDDYFEPFAKQHDLQDSPGGGRKILGERAGSNYRRIRQLCDEIKELEQRIQ